RPLWIADRIDLCVYIQPILFPTFLFHVLVFLQRSSFRVFLLPQWLLLSLSKRRPFLSATSQTSCRLLHSHLHQCIFFSVVDLFRFFFFFIFLFLFLFLFFFLF